MSVIQFLIDFILHLDTHLNDLVISFGPWVYAILFLIVFCETGLVFTPFLPGDSLLFAVGALAAIEGSPLTLQGLFLTFFCAAICGDLTNYTVGKYIGPRIFNSGTSKILNRSYLEKTEGFYIKHGGKTIILARFIPIIRTFAPFVAGIGRMNFTRYATFCLIGAICWIIPLLAAGFYLGNTPVIKQNFHIVVILIIAISVAPAVIEVMRSKRSTAKVHGN